MVLKMPLPTSECCFPLIPLLYPNLMISITKVDFCKNFSLVQPIKHFRDEREGVTVFDRNLVEPPEVHDESQLAIRPLHEHDRGGCRRLGRPDEAIRQIRLYGLLHLRQFWG